MISYIGLRCYVNQLRKTAGLKWTAWSISTRGNQGHELTQDTDCTSHHNKSGTKHSLFSS